MRERPRPNPILRHAVSLMLVLSMLLSALFSWQTYQAIQPGSVADLLVQRGAEDLSRRLETLGPRLAPDAAVEARIMLAFDAPARDWPLIDSLIAILAARGPVPEAVTARYDLLYAQDHGWDDTASQCIKCMWNLENCALDTLSLTCAIPNVALPIGDVFELARAGTAYVTGDEVDTFGATLAAVGLGATVLITASGGGSASIKAGAGVLKLAYRTGSLPPKIIATIMEAARRGIDWSGLARIRHVDDLTPLLRRDALAPVAAIADDIGQMQGKIGLGGSLRILSHAEDAADLNRLTHLTEALGPRTQGMLDLVGKSRLTRTMLRYSDEAIALFAGLGGLMASFIGLLAQMAVTRSLRKARRYLR